MTRLDDRIRDGLQEAGPAAAPDLGALTDEITRRRHHRDAFRRVQMGGLGVVVVLASVAGYLALSRAFTGTDEVPASQTSFGSDGMVLVCTTDVPGQHLCLVQTEAMKDGISQEELVPLTSRDGELVRNPAVSPDGRTVVFDRVRERGAGLDVDVNVELWRIGTDGSDERLLLESTTDGSWSPDGNSIVAVHGGGTSPWQLVVLSPDGDLGSATTLGLQQLADPSYSSDGDTIALTGVDVSSGIRGVTGVFIVTGEGQPGMLPGSRGGSDPSWSAADEVVYVTHPESGDAFRFQRLDGQVVTEVRAGTSLAMSPTVSPDRSWILFDTLLESQDTSVMAIPIEGGEPSSILSPASSPAWVLSREAQSTDPSVRIAGVPFPVCHPMTVPGSFGDGLDTLWVIEREHEVANGDCSAAEGFQYIGVGTTSEVRILSEEVHDIGQNEAALWPFATPDIDGDGIDEIAVGIGGSRTEGYANIVLYRLIDGSISYVSFDCGPTCRPVTWIGIGTFVEGLGGAYCGDEGFVRWSASEGRVIGNVWSLDGDRLVVGEQTFDRSDDGTGYPPDGMSELCGSPTTFPEDFPNYPYEPDGSPTQEPPVVEGDDIGIEKNVCGLDRKGGLDIVPGGDRETAWTGYLVTDAGTCPERNPERQTWIVAVDATGDGVADTWTEIPLINCPNIACFPLDATDLDGDGDGELIVSTSFSIMDQAYFAIDAGDGGFAIRAIEVAAPGHPAAGIEPGAPLQTSSGGDAGYGAWIRCEAYPDAPILVFTSVSSIVESEQPHEWHEVKLQLQGDGLFHVIDATDLSLPPGQDPGLIRSEAPACGVDFRL